MYRERKTRTSRHIPAAELKKKEKASNVEEDAADDESPWKKLRKVPSTKPSSKSKPDNEEFFSGKTIYFVPVEIPLARRNLLARRVKEHGGKVADKLHISGKNIPDYLVVDDRVALDAVCRAMDNNFSDNSEKIIQLLDKAIVVRAQWLSQCLIEKTIVDDSESNINEFLEVL